MKEKLTEFWKFLKENPIVIFVVILVLSTGNTYYITTNDTSSVTVKNNSSFTIPSSQDVKP